ncbi:MAG: hypothetical protein B7X08_03195 [Acidocella sp. 20-63-7]|nr:MAG: hypothetical protein B7X08_03195 [Acidocella sp. 20-63-7]
MLMMVFSHRLMRVAIAVLVGSLSTQALAGTPAKLTSDQLALDAASSPRALLNGLDRLLAADPSLAATPAAAEALARAAAAPVQEFVGANLPIYQEIIDKIVAAAPPGQRELVHRAVSLEINNYIATDVRIMPPAQPLTLGNATAEPPVVGGGGFTMGPVTFYPKLEAGIFYDDNIFATRTSHVSDTVGSISPQISLVSNSPGNALYAEAGTDLTGYLANGRENTADWHTFVEDRIDAGKRTQVLVGAIALMEHEDRSSPDYVEGLVPIRYWELNGYAGLTHRIGDFNLRVGGALEHLTFANTQGLKGEINNHDRNRNRYTFGFSVRDNANPDFRPFVEVLGDIRRYDHIPDDFSYNRNSDGYRASAGARFRLLPSLTGEVSVGIMGRNYADARFNTITTPAADADLRWQICENISTVLFLNRSIEETTLTASPAYVYTVIGGRIEQVLRSDLTGVVRMSLAHSDFRQSSRWDNEEDISVGLRYYLTEYTYLGADYRYTQRVSGDSSVNFSRNEAYFLLGTAF